MTRAAFLWAGLLAAGAGTAGGEDVWVAPPTERTKANPLRPSREGLKRGRTLFLAHCSICHGKGGKGDGPAAAFGMITPRDLTAPAVQARLSDGEMFWKISKGRRVGSDELMPASEEKIASEDLWRVVLFVRSLRPTQN
ncbi:MAG TPA: c-type cytochrome [Vicinamibacteria bacterium]